MMVIRLPLVVQIELVETVYVTGRPEEAVAPGSNADSPTYRLDCAGKSMVCATCEGAAAATSAVALMIPTPQLPAVEQELLVPSLGKAVDVVARRPRTSDSVRVGSTERSRERTPATCGAAIDVP